MSAPLIECIPNFSEGRDVSKVRAFNETIAAVDGILPLDTHSDPDHNRSVVTFAGPPEAVADAAVAAARKAIELIDIGTHHGVHPRLGAIDVLPFVPLRGVDLRFCAELARETGKRIWQEAGMPVYLYEAAAIQAGRVDLADVRRLALDSRPEAAPDLGERRRHSTGGAVAVGARKLLVAFNVELATDDVAIAASIARAVRASSGGLPTVKALGLMLESRNRAQVSMNLTDFEVTSPRAAFDAVVGEATRQGVEVLGSELVGLMPARALDPGDEQHLRIRGFHPGMILENRLAEVARTRHVTIE